MSVFVNEGGGAAARDWALRSRPQTARLGWKRAGTGRRKACSGPKLQPKASAGAPAVRRATRTRPRRHLDSGDTRLALGRTRRTGPRPSPSQPGPPVPPRPSNTKSVLSPARQRLGVESDNRAATLAIGGSANTIGIPRRRRRSRQKRAWRLPALAQLQAPRRLMRHARDLWYLRPDHTLAK